MKYVTLVYDSQAMRKVHQEETGTINYLVNKINGFRLVV